MQPSAAMAALHRIVAALLRARGRERGARIVEGEDLFDGLPLARHVLGAPLREAHAVAEAAAGEHELVALAADGDEDFGQLEGAAESRPRAHDVRALLVFDRHANDPAR